MSTTKKKMDFMALVAPIAKIQNLNLLNADLYRLRQVVGPSLRAGITTDGAFIFYSEDSSTWQRLVGLLPFLTGFREQRIDPVRTKIQLIEVINKDTYLFA